MSKNVYTVYNISLLLDTTFNWVHSLSFVSFNIIEQTSLLNVWNSKC
jgi:hypothetical protein